MAYYGGYQDPSADMYQRAMLSRGARPRTFDEYYRCYPIAMMPGPERESANHGGKIFLPASALDKLTQLHITYPMLFSLHNGQKGKSTHAGVLEFTAEEGRCYLPFWLMVTLSLEPGDLVQTRSTDLPPGRFVKLQAQSTEFLEITDPRAVLETAFRNFSCLTLGDVFTFSYNETVYEVAVLEVKPEGEKKAISVQETDLEVDFAPPVGYEEPTRQSGTSTPHSGIQSNLARMGGMVHSEGGMAQAINYSAIAPSATAEGVRDSTAFSGSGNRLVTKKSKASATAPPPTTAAIPLPKTAARRAGPQPLRLAPGTLFFGYEVKPLKNKDGQAEADAEQAKKQNFGGEGQSLRKKKDAK